MEDEPSLTIPASLDAVRAGALQETIAAARDEFGRTLLGALLTGSAGRGTGTVHSDLDVVLVLDAERQPLVRRSPRVDLIVTSMPELESVPAYDSPEWYLRWMYAWAPIVFDRTAGRIAAAALRQATLTRDETARVLLDHGRLDGWVNLAYRAAKSARAGRPTACRLDAAEAVPWFSEAAFALDGRVRPFNGSLEWELIEHPLPSWAAGEVLGLITGMLDGDPAAIRAAFARIEAECAAFDGPTQQFADVFDAWGDDLRLLRVAA